MSDNNKEDIVEIYKISNERKCGPMSAAAILGLRKFVEKMRGHFHKMDELLSNTVGTCEACGKPMTGECPQTGTGRHFNNE